MNDNRQPAGAAQCKVLADGQKPDLGLAEVAWDEIATNTISEDDVPRWQLFRTHVSAGARPRSAADISGRFRACCNRESVRFLIEVRDDVVVPKDRQSKFYFFNQDAVKLCFDRCRNSEDVIELFALLDPEGVNGAVLIQQRTSGGRVHCSEVPGAGAKAEIREGGYVFDLTIPFSFLGIVPKPGYGIGFDMEIADCDSREIGVKTVLSWSGGQRQKLIYGELLFVE